LKHSSTARVLIQPTQRPILMVWRSRPEPELYERSTAQN
jgi:hypothetical protein